MYFHSIRQWPLAVAIGAIVGAAGIAAVPAVAGPVIETGVGGPMGPVAHTVLNNGPTLYIVTFKEAALAQYDGSNPQFSAIPRVSDASGRSRLDVNSAQAKSYVQSLRSAQQTYLADIQSVLGHALAVRDQLQYALNAAIVQLTPQEAVQVAMVDGVAAVTVNGHHAPATDIGPQFIGATNLWGLGANSADTIFINGFDGNSTIGLHGPGIGDGMVVGDIDTGYNSMSPSFSATDNTGYTITNPLGHGNYKGQCGVANISRAGCNDKVIGVYDLVDAAAPFSVEDTQGHGSHTASTAAGNSRMATLNGYTASISGVAPHANLVVYYVCSPDPAVQCQDTSTVMAVEHSLQDGVVNTLNYSISGGTDPWNGIVEQAFLSASNAGIFVSVAGGNTSASVPAAVPGTVNHWEPWTTTNAAGTHTGGPIAPLFSMTGPGAPPANTQNIPLSETANDTPPTATIPPTTPVKLSPFFHNSDTTGNDGCAPFTAGTFTGDIALLSRGTCAFGTKVQNAVAAGAVAVLISDNRPEGPQNFTLGTPVQPVPAYAIVQGDGTNLKTFLAANSSLGTGTIPYPPSRLPQQPDVLAGFSLLGPSGSGVIKPDVQAPGVNILAAVANDGTVNGPNLVALYDGTSMATPHTTGSGTLLLGLHPDWTPMEVKSALMMTAKETGLTKPDATTPSDYFDRGSGRIRVDIASRAGLVLNETGQRMKAANPATGGNPGTLNIASMENLNCFTPTTTSCSFTRALTSTGSTSVNWTAGVAGNIASAVTVTPTTFTSAANGAQSLQVVVDTTNVTPNASPNYAEVVLTPSDGSPVLHLPIAVAVPAPIINVQSTSTITLGGSATGSTTLPIGNTGGPTLMFNQDTSGDTGFLTLVNQLGTVNNGYFSTHFTDGAKSFYAANQLTIAGYSPVDLGVIYAPGFSVGVGLSTYPAATPLHVSIFADVGGQPAGNPEGGAAAVWTDATTLGGADVQLVGDGIAVFPPTPTQLAAGNYWVTVYPDLPCAAGANGCTRGWAWFLTSPATSPAGQVIEPAAAAPNNGWAPVVENTGFALQIQSAETCSSIPWLAMTPSSGSVGTLASVNTTLTATAASMPAASVTAYLCVASNTGDGNTPVAVQVNATQ